MLLQIAFNFLFFSTGTVKYGNTERWNIVECGMDTIASQCSLCPKANHTDLTSWCGGGSHRTMSECEINETTGICQKSIIQ